MSVVASVKVYDGIVIGAESMTQLVANAPGAPQPVVLKAYSHATKIFRIADYHIGALTYGIGSLGNRSMEGLVHEFSQEERENAAPDCDRSVEAVATRLFNFMHEKYEAFFANAPAAQRPPLGFYIAGFNPTDHSQHLGTEWEFKLPASTAPVRARPDNLVGASWRGIDLPFTRLFFGVDPRVEGILAGLGVNQDTILAFRQAVSTQLLSRVVFDGMPIQDAVDFCRFIIKTTIGAATFEIGQASCGGPIHLAVITRTGFKWISAPKISISEEKTDDHD